LCYLNKKNNEKNNNYCTVVICMYMECPNKCVETTSNGSIVVIAMKGGQSS